MRSGTPNARRNRFYTGVLVMVVGVIGFCLPGLVLCWIAVLGGTVDEGQVAGAICLLFLGIGPVAVGSSLISDNS
jgi:hypothetical protein